MFIRYTVYILILISPSVYAFDLDDLNYGFSAYLGSGIYTTGEQAVQVYQLPVSYEVYSFNEDGHSLIVNVPVTLGFYNFALKNIVASGLPDNVSTLSVVPGIETLYKINKNWKFGPFVDIGVASNLENDSSNYIYSLGFNSHYQFDIKSPKITLANKLLYAQHGASQIEGADDFASIETVIDFQFFSAANRYYDFISLYYANYRYYDELVFLQPNNKTIKVFAQNEIGISFGIRPYSKISYINISRLGIGYRFGDKLSVFRIILSAPF